MIRKLLSSLAVVLLFAPFSFGLIPVSTGTAVCNGSNVSLDYTSLFNSSGTVINFTIDVLSISGATIDSVTCSGGAAIYALSGSQFTVTFGPPIIGTDTTTYTSVFGTISFPSGGLTNYESIFRFTDSTSGITFGPPPGGNLLVVATNSTSVNGNFALSSGNITFDPPGTELFIYADFRSPGEVPEPGTWVLVSTALGGMAVLRRKFAV